MTPKDVAGSLWKKFEAYAKEHPHEKVGRDSVWCDIWLAVGILKTLDALLREDEARRRLN